MSTSTASAKCIFLQALELPPGSDRLGLLDAQCGDNTDLRREVEKLLSHHAEIGDFLESPPTAVIGVADTFFDTRCDAPALSFLSPADRPGSLGRLGHYVILEVLGHGGFGVVLKAHDEQLQRIVAIKSLAESLAGSVHARQRFVREARAAAAINHDYVVRVYGVEEASPVPYLVMEYIAGFSLEEKLRRDGLLKLDEVRQIGYQIAEGLSAAHAQGLVHRDIKPGNILLEAGTGRVKITDFGLARAVDDISISREGVIAGTPEYMAPEQASGGAVDHRADLFSLGSVLYAMCCGRSPFAADGSLAVLHRLRHDSPQPVQQLRPETPEGLARLIAHLHAKQPSDRPQSAAEVQTLLSHTNERTSLGKPRQRWSRRRWLIVAGTTIVVGSLGYGFSRLLSVQSRQSATTFPASLPAEPVLPQTPPAATPDRRPQRVLIVTPSRDFTYSEVDPLRNHLRMYQVDWHIASTTLNECRPQPGGPPIQLPVKPDLLLADAKAADYDAIYFCGGKGVEELAGLGQQGAEVRRLIEEVLAIQCTVSAMSQGVTVLAEAKVLQGRRVACYPWNDSIGIVADRLKARGAICTDQGVVEDGPFLTGREPGDMRAFIFALLKRLGVEPRPPPSPSRSP